MAIVVNHTSSIKVFDEGFSSKNYVRKFLRALHPKWRAKVTAIEESKGLSSLALDELIGNLKVHEVVTEKGSEIYRGKKERIKSIALKAKKESIDDENLTTGSDEEEYAMAKGKCDRKCFRCGDPNHLIGDCTKPSRNKDQKAFIGGSWSDSENDTEDKTNNKTCLMAQSSNEVTLNSFYYSDNASSLDNDSMQIEYDSLCEISLKIINKNKIFKTKRDLLEKEILELNEKIKKLERSKEIEIVCKSWEELKLKNTKLKETQVKFVKFDKSDNSLREMLNNQKSSSCKVGLGFDSGKASTSGTKTMSIVGSSAEKAMDGSTLPGSVCLRTCLEPDEWIKDSGCSKHMTGNKSLFSTYKAYNGVKESVNVIFDESPPPTKLSPLVDDDVGEEEAIKKNTKVVNNNNEEDESVEVDEIVNIKESKNHPLYQVYVAQPPGFIDFQKPNHAYKLKKALYGLKQAPKAWSSNKTNDIKEMLKKFELEDSKPTKKPMSMEIKLIKDGEADLVDSSKYRGAIDLSKNIVQRSRTKHIEIHHHFLRDNVQKGNISIKKVASEDNIADIFTKPLKREVFNYSRLGLGIMELIMDSDPLSS
ncbi:zf-CCHC domain-containing protein [Tanacetum coccineum]